jgi:UDP-N-acetylmuramyl pentapeptide phosphotransferase/UDP-N-acetylglucosamine-1-phosphate transferase
MSDPSIPNGPKAGSHLVRPVLWLVLVVSAAANAVASTTGVNVLAGLGAGLVTLACAVALIVHHYRHRGR